MDRVTNPDATFCDYGLLMGIGKADTFRMRKRLAKYGHLLFHDHRGLPIMSIDTAGKITQLSYDDAGRLTTLSDPMKHATT